MAFPPADAVRRLDRAVSTEGGLRTEGDLRSRRRPAASPSRPSGAPALAAKALDHLGALVGLDPGWVIRSATPGLARLTGRPASEAIGQPLHALLHPDTAAATIETLAQAAQGGTPVVVSGTLGTNRPILLVPTPNAAPSAEIYVFLSDLFATVAEARRPREDAAQVFRARLVEIEERLLETGLLFEAAGDLSASLDLAEVLDRIVDHAARLCRAQRVAVDVLDPDTGLLSVAAISGTAPPVSPLPVPRDATPAGRALVAGAAIEVSGDEVERHSARYATPEEGLRLRTALAVPLVADAATLGALVLCRASTRPFEPADVRRAQHLARRAAVAVVNARRYGALRRELTELREGQARLVQAEKMAALGKLGAGAAHEINNPLTAIVGNAELLLRREPLTPAARERVERVLQSASRAARVIRQLLAAVRALPPELAPTDVVSVVREAVAARRRDLELDGVDVVDELGPLPVVQADGQQLAQAFASILDNALDAVRAMPPDQGRVIRLTSRVQPGRIRLRIENTGHPIADDSLARIFDPFFTTKSVGQGAGLGLSVCQGIVGAHGGRVYAENVPRGVAIVVDLPVPGPADGGPEDRRPAA